MASPERSLSRQPVSRRSGLAALVPLALMALALPVPALADRPDSRAAELQLQEAQGLARLSTPDLHNYFEARRQLERRAADQRLSDLRQLEDCLERTRQRAGADSCLTQARQRREQQRQRGLAELSSLRQRYGLPALPGAAAIQPRPSWLPPQFQQPQVHSGYQSRYSSGYPSASPSPIPAYGWH
mgnify:CR=1 FL=1